MELKEKIKELKERAFATNLSRAKTGLACVVALGILLTLVLPGTVPAQNLQVINGAQYLSHTYDEPQKASVGYVDSTVPTWSLGGGSGASAQLTSPSVTYFSGVFKPSSSSSSIQITKDLFVNLEEYPIMFVQVNATPGIFYGIRLYSSYDNKTSIPLWSNSDILNHRSGTSAFQNIQVNVPVLSKLNTGETAQNITELQVYAERGPSNSSTPFTIVLQNLEFLNYGLTTYQPNKTYHAVYFTFDNLPTAGNSSWVLNKIDVQLNISAPIGTAYEVYQLNGSLARTGSLYHFSNSIASYDYSLYPKGSQIAFSDSIPPGHGFSVVVVAQSGYFNSVQLQNIQFVFTPAQNATQAVTAATVASQGAFWYSYLTFFLFVAPLGAALYMYYQYRRSDGEDFKPWQIGLAITAGVISRIALAPVAAQPFDISVYATSARGWFEFRSPGTSLGPTLPFTFFLYWVPYSFYAVLLKLGFHDFYILGHTTGFVETIFLKAFPMSADLFVSYLIFRFDSSRTGKLLALFYLLNPLSIYVSSVWGQYEASTIGFVVLGFLFMWRKANGDQENSQLEDLKASLSFVISSLIEIVGLIPLAFLIVKSALTRPFKIASTLILALPLALLFVYPPETHLIYLIFAAAVGASSVLLLSQPHTPYTILSNFPQLAPLHPLVILLGIIGIVFIARRQYDLKNIVTFTLFSFIVFLLFSAQQPQWWVFVLPLGLIYGIVSERQSIGPYILAFGTMVAFLTLSFTQGSGYMLFGNAKYDIIPSIENLKNGIDLFTVTTTVGALTIVGYLLLGERITGTRPLLRSALILFGVLLISFVWFSVLGAAL